MVVSHNLTEPTVGRGWMAASPSPVSFYWGKYFTSGDPKKPLTVELPILLCSRFLRILRQGIRVRP
uniref:Uncharacterized protein n=1 Tax=Anguilla anguilla TaxID=7936 RepID=A0A0E9WXE2_ANGAN